MNTFRTTEDCRNTDALMQHWNGGHADGYAEGYWAAMRYTGGLCIVAAGVAVVCTLVVLGWLS